MGRIQGQREEEELVATWGYVDFEVTDLIKDIELGSTLRSNAQETH